jgi:hypothetical protein
MGLREEKGSKAVWESLREREREEGWMGGR